MGEVVILIDGLNVGHGTGVKDSEQTSTNQTVCFDEVVTQGAPKTGYTLEIDRLVYETREDYILLRDKIKSMKSKGATITVRETVQFKNEAPYTIVKNYPDCILDGRDHEWKPEEHTVQNLKFITGEVEEDIEDN